MDPRGPDGWVMDTVSRWRRINPLAGAIQTSVGQTPRSEPEKYMMNRLWTAATDRVPTVTGAEPMTWPFTATTERPWWHELDHRSPTWGWAGTMNVSLGQSTTVVLETAAICSVVVAELRESAPSGCEHSTICSTCCWRACHCTVAHGPSVTIMLVSDGNDRWMPARLNCSPPLVRYW